MVILVFELTQEQRELISKTFGIESPPVLLILAESQQSLKEELKNYEVREKTPLAALAE